MIIELAKHIENLLLENDCVIIPGFGGFIVQYIPARRIKEENIFLSPCRAVGFNPQLNLNDGLLIQSYMQAYDMNYPEACRLVDDVVLKLREQLSEKGEVEIYGVGKLILNIENTIDFCPNEDGVFTPSLYGFSSFEMFELSKEMPALIKYPVEETMGNNQKYNTLIIRINRAWLKNTVAIAAAILFFFFLSTPVDNTYVDPENYASLGDAGLFNHIRSQSVATSLIKVTDSERMQETVLAFKGQTLKKKSIVKEPEKKEPMSMSEKNMIKVQISSDEVFSEKKEKTDKVCSNVIEGPVIKKKKLIEANISNNASREKLIKQVRYHIIVASVTNVTDAEKSIQFFADRGYPGGTMIKGDGRVRIAISSFTDRKAADAEWVHLRKTELFQNAWILTSRDK